MTTERESLPRQSSCPTCGQAVEVASSDEGTSYYVGIDAWDASTLRSERDAAIAAATMELRKALREAQGEIVRIYMAGFDSIRKQYADAAFARIDALLGKETSGAF